MIGANPTGKDGKPLDGNKLSLSAYQPPKDVMDLFSRCQNDYQRAWRLQHRSFDEFDGLSLLQRAKRDQETFGAFVGAQFIPEQNRWRFNGRKNTARDKIITILAHMIAGMLYPMVRASNEENETDETAARVMRIIVENHLKKADYEMKFMYFVLSALVNPATIVEVQYLEAIQRVKDGNGSITEAVDTILSGLNLNVVPIDQILFGDFFVNDVQSQPFIIRVNRIPYDMARKIYAGRYYQDGVDLFDYVEAGKTRVFLAGQEHMTLYDIEWTEADRTAVQVITCYYRDEDLELDWVGGVGMFNYKDPINTNRFKHRRMSLINDEWKSIPIYPFAKTYFEPIDPTGRFLYGKSASFKIYWEDRSINHSYQLLQDGMTLEVAKPLFISGASQVDNIVIAPGAVTGIPQGASVLPWSMSPALSSAMQVIQKNEQDMSESTQDKIMGGVADPNITATQSIQAQNQGILFLGVFSRLIGDLVSKIGELTIDVVIQHTTNGELDTSVSPNLLMKYKPILAQTSEKGKNMTHRIHFKSELIGKSMTKEQMTKYEWKLWNDKGGEDQEVWHINPYKFARTMYSMSVDPQQILDSAMGNDKQRKLLRYQMLTQQFVYPFTDQKEVADAVIEEFSDGDPDRFKGKGTQGNPQASAGMETPNVPNPLNASAGTVSPLKALTQ